MREKREGYLDRVRDEINEEKWGGKEIKKELSWRECYMHPFGPYTAAIPLRTSR